MMKKAMVSTLQRSNAVDMVCGESTRVNIIVGEQSIDEHNPWQLHLIVSVVYDLC